jgi:hypothetical protein
MSQQLPSDPAKYRLLSEHFQACIDLPEKERREYVVRAGGTDPSLGESLRSLLKHHQAPQAKPVRGDEPGWRRRRRLTPSLILAFGLTTGVLVWFLRAGVLNPLESHLKEEAGRRLREMVESRADSIQAWAVRKKALARSVLEDPTWSALATERLSRVSPELGDSEFCILSPAGRVLSGTPDCLVGQWAPASLAGPLREMSQGEWIVARPSPGNLAPDDWSSVVIVGGPLRAPDGEIIALGLFRFSARELDALLRLPESPGLRGGEVLRAWTWIPELNRGLGTEQDVGSVLAPLRPLKISFDLVLAGCGVLTIGFLGWRYVRSRSASARSRRIGNYLLECPIGSGGSGVVYRAMHVVLKRPTAIKLLRGGKRPGPILSRFEREAQLASRLGHPGFTQIFEFGETDDGQPYYAMEFIEGLNLAQLVSLTGPLPVSRALNLLRQIAEALEEAHALGIRHRDLKPSNIMVGMRGCTGDIIKILDFGIASAGSADPDDAARSTDVLGTPAFMAPERIRAPQRTDFRSDLYSFGAVAFHLLTGRTVFEGPGPVELLYQVLTAERPSPSLCRKTPLPRDLERLVLNCLAIEIDSRPSDIGEIVDALSWVEAPDRWGEAEARAWWESNRERAAGLVRASL